MQNPAKTKRTYTSTRRQKQAADTRQSILAAAQTLFFEQGYSGTTIQSIAESAGVAIETIYAIFGSKKTILASLVNLAEIGEDLPIPLLEKIEAQKIKEQTDLREQIRLFSSDVQKILERVSPIIEVLRAAAKFEPEINVLLQQILAERFKNIYETAGWLIKNAPLREGYDQMSAAETLWAFTSSELYCSLIIDRGWSGEKYEKWLSDVLITSLFRIAND